MKRRAAFYGQLIHTGDKCMLVIPEKEFLAQRAWEALDGKFKNTPGDSIRGEMFVRVYIYEDDKGKDSALNRYFFGTLLPQLQKGMYDLGNDHIDTTEKAYEELKVQFLKPDADGIYSTKGLGKREFEDFVSRCERLGTNVLGLTLTSKTDKNFPADER